MPELMTAGQVAKLLGVNRVTVWKWRKAGRIFAEAIYVPGGRVWGYRREEVRRMKKELAARVEDNVNGN